MTRAWIAAVSMAACLLAPPSPAAAQIMSRCAECHFANLASVPAPGHLEDWKRSAHGRHGIGCEWCHGGDPTTFVPADAHRDVLPSANPLSRVYRSSLPRTCRMCHAREATSFARSLHNVLLQGADARVPTCSTCHGAMTARVPSPAALERQCAACHTAASARADYPMRARQAVEAIDRIRGTLIDAQQRIQKIDEGSRRRQLWATHLLAVSTLAGAVEAVHAFDFGVLDDRLRQARERADALMTEIGKSPR